MTLAIMAGIAVYMFLGITFVVSRFGLVPEADQTLVSSLGRAVWGENVIYYALQATTAMVLFLAANSSFNAFPLLGSILARDRYLPRQFNFRGDRLAFSSASSSPSACRSWAWSSAGGRGASRAGSGAWR